MTDRDALAALIHCCQSDRPEDCMGPTDYDYERADAILAAGWRAPAPTTPAPDPPCLMCGANPAWGGFCKDHA